MRQRKQFQWFGGAFAREAAVATALVFLLFSFLKLFPFKFEFVKPIKQELNDFDIYDLIYAGVNQENATRDTNIVLVQAANSRAGIARQLRTIKKYSPRVIGVDLFFPASSGDPLADRVLAAELNTSDVVVGTKLEEEPGTGRLVLGKNYFDTAVRQNETGYFNFSGDQVAVVRSYYPYIKMDGRWLPAFTTLIAQQYNPSSYRKLEQRKDASQTIHYTGNLENFTVLTQEDLEGVDSVQLSQLLNGKAVLLGILYIKDPLILEDLHFTPVNDRIQGKSYPDMYGLVIHANILSMIFHGMYPTQLPNMATVLIALLITFMLMYYQVALYARRKHPSHLGLILLQFVLIILFLYAAVVLFRYAHVKIPLLPVILCIALSIETFAAYIALATWLHRKFHYQTIFSKNHS